MPKRDTLYLEEVTVTERLANEIAYRNAWVASVGARNGSDVLPPEIVEELTAKLVRSIRGD